MGTALDGRRRRPRHGRSAGRCRTPSSLRVVRNQALPFGGRLSAIGTGAMAPQPSMARNLAVPLGCWGLLAYIIFQLRGSAMRWHSRKRKPIFARGAMKGRSRKSCRLCPGNRYGPYMSLTHPPTLVVSATASRRAACDSSIQFSFVVPQH